MDRTGVSDKRGQCQVSFVYQGERFRPVLSGLSFARAGDRKAAAQILATVQREIRTGTFYFPKHFPDHPAAKRFQKGHQILVGEALKLWLKDKREKVEPTTYRGYEKVVLHHLVPKFGARRLSEIRTSEVETWLASLDICGKSKNNILIPLRALYRKAFRDDLIERDPIDRIGHQAHRAKQP